jgi:hypothetical protein
MTLQLLAAVLVTVTPELEEGRAAFSSLKYQQAITALTTVTTTTGATSQEKAEAFGLIARSWLALGKTANAQTAFEGQLTEDPMAEEPPGAPKVKQAFLAAKRARFPAGYVQLVQRPSTEGSLVLDVVNPWRAPLLVLAWEATTADYVKKVVTLDGNRAVLALQRGSRTWVEVVSPDGKRLASFASAAEPVAGPKVEVVVIAREPEKKEPPRDAPVETKKTPVDAPPPPPIVVTTSQGMAPLRVAGFVIAGVGLVAAIVGGVLAGIGSSTWANGKAMYDKGDGFPFTVMDLTEAERLKAEGTRLMTEGSQTTTLGGITAGAGGAVLVGGVLLAIFAKD